MCSERNDRRLRRGDRGVTLLEVLISSALFAFVMGGVYLLYTTMLGTMNRGELAAGEASLRDLALRIGDLRKMRKDFVPIFGAATAPPPRPHPIAG